MTFRHPRVADIEGEDTPVNIIRQARHFPEAGSACGTSPRAPGLGVGKFEGLFSVTAA